jgi:hypothetical protein
MKEKRARQAAERRKKEEAAEQAKAAIKARLLALQVWRTKDAKKPPETVPEKIEVGKIRNFFFDSGPFLSFSDAQRKMLSHDNLKHF